MVCAHALALRTVAHFAREPGGVQRLEPRQRKVSLLLVHLRGCGRRSMDHPCVSRTFHAGRMHTAAAIAANHPPKRKRRTSCTSSSFMRFMSGPTVGMASQVSSGASTLPSITLGRRHCAGQGGDRVGKTRCTYSL